MKIEAVELEEITSKPSNSFIVDQDQLNLVADVQVELKVELGDAELTIKELYDLRIDSVLTLNSNLNDRLKITLNGKTVASGLLVAVGDNFGVQITDIAR